MRQASAASRLASQPCATLATSRQWSLIKPHILRPSHHLQQQRRQQQHQLGRPAWHRRARLLVPQLLVRARLQGCRRSSSKGWWPGARQGLACRSSCLCGRS
jgi:hypothetical protein